MVENRDPISKALTSQLAHENNEASMFQSRMKLSKMRPRSLSVTLFNTSLERLTMYWGGGCGSDTAISQLEIKFLVFRTRSRPVFRTRLRSAASRSLSKWSNWVLEYGSFVMRAVPDEDLVEAKSLGISPFRENNLSDQPPESSLVVSLLGDWPGQRYLN